MNEKINNDALAERAKKLCSEREYCESDIKGKLTSWGADEKSVRSVTELLKKEKYIDEDRYAGAFARDRFRYQKWGKVKIAAAMKLKKIPGTIINSALDTIDEREYYDSLKTIITTHRKNVKAKNQYDLRGKLIRHALAKGYESTLVYEMVSGILSD